MPEEGCALYVAFPVDTHLMMSVGGKIRKVSQRTTPTIRLVRRGKTQINQRIRAEIRVFADRMCPLQPPGYSKWGRREPLPYWMYVQDDLSLCWSHWSYCRFCRALGQMSMFWFKNTLSLSTSVSNSIILGRVKLKRCLWTCKNSGSSCSKLTMSLVNVSLNLWSLNMAYMLIFLLKKCE